MASVRSLMPDLGSHRTLARPNEPGEGNWAGAPSVVEGAGGDVWITYRLRDPERRGHALVVARSEGRGAFRPVRTIGAAELGATSVERAASIYDAETGTFETFLSYDDGTWRIAASDPAPTPAKTDVSTLRPLESLMTPEVTGVKDPYLFSWRGERWMLYTAYIGGLERLMAARRTGARWEPIGAPLLENEGWHRMFTRPSCALPSEDGLVILYEGCAGTEYSPLYNLRVGAAHTEDMRTAVDLSPEAPLLESPTAGKFATLRYLAPLDLKDEAFFFYEAACEDGTFELRWSPMVEQKV